MSKFPGIFSFLMLGLILLCLPVVAQESKGDLEKKRKKIEDDISYTNHLLSETRKSKQNTINEISLINSKLNKRNELIATVKKEVYLLKNEISQTENSIKNLNKDLVLLREEYSKVIYFAYKYKTSYNKLIYLFSSEDLNQGFQRMRYLDQIGEFIRDEAKTIREKEDEKQKQLKLLKGQRLKKNSLLDKESIQLYKLEDEKVRKNKINNKILAKEKGLRAQLRKKEREARKLEKKIEDIIALATKPKTTKGKVKSYSLTPEEKHLSTSFISNKGKLPWPTARGVISSSYGVHAHPVLRNVKTKNNGLNIATSKGSDARSIFEGKVVSVTTITNKNRAVIIRHGEYFSVYSNLETVYVKAGDKVKVKEVLGRIHTTGEGKTELHFEIWKNKSLQNPAYWIKR
jgi:septal ring factor EnvC (AmiA/AmiB activator)